VKILSEHLELLFLLIEDLHLLLLGHVLGLAREHSDAQIGTVVNLPHLVDLGP
jgi:hypothetical protein